MKIDFKNSNILILAPHTDDGEFGCGGTISKTIESGAKVIYVAFSAAETSVPPEWPRDILRTEVKNAVSKLGISKENCIVYNFEVRRFLEFRQDILEKMIQLDKEFNPDIVFLPSTNDTHQDHNVIAHEGFRAFKKKIILGYEIPWNNLDFRTSCFIELEKKHLDSKIRALMCYKSQKNRSYANAEFIKSLMITRGTQIGKKYAEAFEIIRWVIN